MGFPLVELIQRYVAVTSVGASEVRGSPAGTADAARAFLACLDLHRFGTANAEAFQSELDSATEKLVERIPAHAWGVARKVLNIFLHNAFYNHYLRTEYQLDLAESLFEVPVDSAVARGLRSRAGKDNLPAWLGVKALTPDTNRRYQETAVTAAKIEGCSRVHLDPLLWLENR
jgi:hypothetical protein